MINLWAASPALSKYGWSLWKWRIHILGNFPDLSGVLMDIWSSLWSSCKLDICRIYEVVWSQYTHYILWIYTHRYILMINWSSIVSICLPRSSWCHGPTQPTNLPVRPEKLNVNLTSLKITCWELEHQPSNWRSCWS